MLQGVSADLETAFPPGLETQGDVEDALHIVAKMIIELHKNPEYYGFLRMVAADSRQFPWTAAESAAVMDPLNDRLAKYLAHLARMGVLDCPDLRLATHVFMGVLNEFPL